MNSKILYLARIICNFLPETRCFGLKRTLYRMSGANIGRNVRICSSAMIIGGGILSIGDNTWIGHRCLISVSSEISIGKDCDIAPDVYIGTGSHSITPDGIHIGGDEYSKNITIGGGSWICAKSIILPGVSIGNMCVVAAGSVVNCSCEKFSLIAGVPAKLKRVLK